MDINISFSTEVWKEFLPFSGETEEKKKRDGYTLKCQ